MFGLMVCLLFTEWQQPGTISGAFRTTFSRLERTYGDTSTSVIGQLFLNVFRIGTLALAINLLTTNGEFLFSRFAIIMGAILAVMLVKMLLSWLIGYTFELRRSTEIYLPHYDNLWTVLTVLLYPLVLIYIHLSDSLILPWLLLIVAILFLIAVFVKMFMHFFAGARTAIYIAMYLITLEVLPWAVVVYGATQL